MPRPPQAWTRQKLEREPAQAKKLFVAERLACLKREQAAYERRIKTYSTSVQALLDATQNLTNRTGASIKIRPLLDALRDCVSPVVSLDDPRHHHR